MRTSNYRVVLGIAAVWFVAVAPSLLRVGTNPEEERRLLCAEATRRAGEGDSTGRVCKEAPGDETFQRVVVVVAGMPRSGSSVAYNAVRLLMEEIDPNTVSGWHGDLTDFVEKHKTKQMRVAAACDPQPVLAHLRHLRASLLIKVHKHSEFHALSSATMSPPTVDLVIGTHRDPADVVRSLRNQGNWTRYLSDAELDDPKTCSTTYGFPQTGRMFQEADWAVPTEWPRVAKIWLKCYATIEQTTGAALYELPYNKSRSTVELVSALAARLQQFKGWSFTAADVSRIAKRVDKLVPPACNPLSPEMHPVSNLHKGHIHSKAPPTPLEAAGMERIKADPRIAAWRAGKGYQ